MFAGFDCFVGFTSAGLAGVGLCFMCCGFADVKGFVALFSWIAVEESFWGVT